MKIFLPVYLYMSGLHVCVCVCVCIFLRLVFCFYSVFTLHVWCMCWPSCYLQAKEANIETLER